MATFYIRQHSLTSNTRTVVRDENQQAQFLLVGCWGTRGDVLSLYLMNGEVVATIKQATFALTRGTRFELYQNFQKVGTLHRLLAITRDYYYVHQLGWVVTGNIAQQHYTIHARNRRVMTMESAILPEGNFYLLDIPQADDAPLCICIAAVLNYWVQIQKPADSRLKKFMPNQAL